MSSIRDVVEAFLMFYSVCAFMGIGVYVIQRVFTTAKFSSGLDLVWDLLVYSTSIFLILMAFGTVVYVLNLGGVRDRIEEQR